MKGLIKQLAVSVLLLGATVNAQDVVDTTVWNDTLAFWVTEGPPIAITFQPPLNMVFYDEDTLMLKISWDSGMVRVEYDSIDAAGKLFFDWLQSFIEEGFDIKPKGDTSWD